MRPSLTLRLAALGGWPRRLAALACLLLAAATALQPTQPKPTATGTPTRISDGLNADEAAVPVPLANGAACTLLKAGDRVDLYPGARPDGTVAASTAPAGSGLQVLAVLDCHGPAGLAAAADAPVAVVAAGPTAAARLAGFLPTPMLAVLRASH